MLSKSDKQIERSATMFATATTPTKLQADLSTAEHALKQKRRDEEIVSDSHLVAKTPENEGVDTIFLCC